MRRNHCDKCGSRDIAVMDNSDSVNERTLCCRDCGKVSFEVYRLETRR